MLSILRLVNKKIIDTLAGMGGMVDGRKQRGVSGDYLLQVERRCFPSSDKGTRASKKSRLMAAICLEVKRYYTGKPDGSTNVPSAVAI